MNYEWFLTTFGLTQNTLECILIIGGLTAVIGYAVVLLWRFILGGLCVLAVLFVFAHHKEPEAAVKVKTPSTKEVFFAECMDNFDNVEYCKEKTEDL